MAILENWSITLDDSNPFKAPEMRAKVLQGYVYGHDRIKDGTLVITSNIQNIDVENRMAETMNTIYHLGKPSEEYAELLKQRGIDYEDTE